MSKLESDDIEVGQHVTVLEWKPRTTQVATGGLFGSGGGVETITHNDTSGCGDVFLVLAVDRPFVVLKPISGMMATALFDGRSWTVDTRLCSLKALSPEFVAAVMPPKKAGAP